MRIIVIGGRGLIGKQVVANLRTLRHDAVAASPSSGVNAVTGEGLATALAGAHVVVDVANSPSFEDQAVLEFFEKSSRNLLTAEKAAGVKQHVALSIVGCDLLPDSGYMRAKVAQENVIKAGGVPYSILRATQFMEFLGAIAGSNADGQTIRMPPGLMQPVAAVDVAAAVTDLAVNTPLNGTVDLAGPEAVPLDELIRRYLKARPDGRQVVTDPEARYFGTRIDNGALAPRGSSRIGAVRLEQWLVAN